MIDFETEINDYRPSLEVDAIEDAIVRSDLTDMNLSLIHISEPTRRS